MRLFLMYQGSLNPKNRFLLKKSVLGSSRTLRHTGTHESEYRGHPLMVSGISPSSIIKDRSNKCSLIIIGYLLGIALSFQVCIVFLMGLWSCEVYISIVQKQNVVGVKKNYIKTLVLKWNSVGLKIVKPKNLLLVMIGRQVNV